MVFGKMKLLAVATTTAAVIASLAFAAVAHNKAAAVNQGFVAHHVAGPDGKLIGSAGNASIRSQWQQDGLPD
jgi:hypothetical protein